MWTNYMPITYTQLLSSCDGYGYMAICILNFLNSILLGNSFKITAPYPGVRDYIAGRPIIQNCWRLALYIGERAWDVARGNVG